MGVITRIELSDRSFVLREILDLEVTNLKWEYSRIGGCGGFSFVLPRKYLQEKYISGDFNVKIKVRNDSTGVFDLWYQGVVENKVPKVQGVKEEVSVSGHGYSTQLSRIQVDKDYSNQEVSVIVKDILDTYITPNTDITYSAGDVVSTGINASFEFNTDAKSALESCANLVGTREWGVDKDRKFFFKARSSTAGYIFPLQRLSSFSSNQSFKDIVNRVIIQGAESGGTPFTRTVNDASSQLKYGLREKVVQNSSITNNTDADNLGAAYLSEFSDVVRSADCVLEDYDTKIETTIPIPLFTLQQVGTQYGQKKYGTFLYSGLINRQISKINYAVDNNGKMQIKLTLDKLKPSLAEKIAQIEYDLEQQRSDSL